MPQRDPRKLGFAGIFRLARRGLVNAASFGGVPRVTGVCLDTMLQVCNTLSSEGLTMPTIKHWTTFHGRPNSYLRADGLRVTLSPRGDIYLNKFALDSLDNPEAVELLFDMNRDVVGVKPVEAWQENSFPVRPKSGTEAGIIHASPFFNHFSIKTKRTVTFNQAHIDSEGILTLPLEGITAVTRGSR